MELKKYKLGDIAEVTTGFPFDGNLYSNNGIRVVRGENIGNGEMHWDKRIDKRWEGSLSNLSKYYLFKGDIVMQMDGNVGKNISIILSEEPMLIAQRVACIRAKHLDNQKFVYHILRSKYFNTYIKNNATGTSVKHISLQQIKDFSIPLPNRNWKQIGNLLSSLDQKIALNRKINDNLEAMAKQLYDYWFVQFDFPNEEGKPYKSSGGKMVWNEKLKREIPEGWYADNICRIADILSGGTPSKQVDSYWQNGNIPFFGPTDYTGAIFQLTTAEHITNEGLKHCASSRFEEGVVIITARGSIGKIVVVGTPMAMNQSCYAFRSRNDEFEYLFFLTAQLIEHLKAKGSGSVFKSIITADIENSILSIADETTITLFTSTIRPLMNAIKENTKQIETLTKQRDELLPLLMNGQVSVN